jgi:hypothetical protein
MPSRTADRRSTVQRILWATDNDVAEFLSFFTERSVFQMGNGDQVIGRDAITAWVSSYLASVTGTTHQINTIWESDEAFAVQSDVTYRMQSGVSLTLPAMTEMRLQDDKLTHYLIYIDPSLVVEAS